jgi:hypothetical protein
MRTKNAIAADVDEGLRLVRAIAAAQAALKPITARLKKDAIAAPHEHEPLKDAEREGMQFIAHGSDGKELRIVITADKLLLAFPDGSEQHERIRTAAGEHFRSFYQPHTEWHAVAADGKAFRTAARTILGEDKAPAFIAHVRDLKKNGLPKNDVKLEWPGDEESEGEE